jgi:hypothetical protein
MEPLAATLPLVRWTIPSVRMERHQADARVFRTRSSLARIVGCALEMPWHVVAEDGIHLRRIDDLATLRPGEYYSWRDEVYFTSTDGTDPAHNGRVYSVLMPACVAAIESLPLHEIESRRL